MNTLWGQSQELETGYRTYLRIVRGLWKDHPYLTSMPKVKGAANVKREEGRLQQPLSISFHQLKTFPVL